MILHRYLLMYIRSTFINRLTQSLAGLARAPARRMSAWVLSLLWKSRRGTNFSGFWDSRVICDRWFTWGNGSLLDDMAHTLEVMCVRKSETNRLNVQKKLKVQAKRALGCCSACVMVMRQTKTASCEKHPFGARASAAQASAGAGSAKRVWCARRPKPYLE